MGIKLPQFEKKEIEIRETYIDENGKQQERIKKVFVPTGKVLEGTQKNSDNQRK